MLSPSVNNAWIESDCTALLSLDGTWAGLVSFLLPGIYPLMKRVTYWPQAWLGPYSRLNPLYAGLAI
jgi:4-hydroxybenzoate polyprenyltransferase